jgi:hypothetical protein
MAGRPRVVVHVDIKDRTMQHEPCTAEEKQERLAVIRDMIVRGMPKPDIVKTCQAEYSWNISDRMIYYYMQDVWAELSNAALGIDRKAHYDLTIERFDYLYGLAVKAGNLKVANDILANKAKLMKLDTPTAVDWRKAAAAAGIEPTDAVTAFAQMLIEGKGNELKQ